MSGWTKEKEDLLKKLWNSGLNCSSIGKRFNKTKNAIIGKAWRMKLKKRKQTHSSEFWTPKEEYILRRDWPKNIRVKEIVKNVNEISPTGRTKTAVTKKASKLGLIKPKRKEQSSFSTIRVQKRRMTKSIFDLEDNHLVNVNTSKCVWIDGEPVDGICCSEPTVNGVYCEKHLKRSLA